MSSFDDGNVPDESKSDDSKVPDPIPEKRDKAESGLGITMKETKELLSGKYIENIEKFIIDNLQNRDIYNLQKVYNSLHPSNLKLKDISPSDDSEVDRCLS